MSKTILLVDDETHDTAHLIAALRNAGIENEVVVARGGRNAWSLFGARGRFGSRELPAMILVPSGVDVLSFVEKLRARARTRKIPLFVLGTFAGAPERLQ